MPRAKTTGFYPASFNVANKELWGRFKDVVRREGKTATDVLREFVQNYVDKHEPGNPQARITSYGKGGSVDLAIVEGRIRERFRRRIDAKFNVIIDECKEKLGSTKSALAMAERIADWLKERDIKVWR